MQASSFLKSKAAAATSILSRRSSIMSIILGLTFQTALGSSLQDPLVVIQRPWKGAQLWMLVNVGRSEF